ncbi:MAG: hypothetical protein RBT73_04745 [Spirochaetia bacterium]|jgi:hypothetical protein|nr:hypothetical protein [Spirochaetia bacterium]
MNALLKKMNYKLGPLVILDAPKEFEPVIAAWKSEVEVLLKLPAEGSENKAGFILVFTASEAEVKSKIPPLRSRVDPSTVFWVAFPKKTSPEYSSDINRDILWKLMEPMGFSPNRNVAIDEDWSALRFAPSRHP